MRLEAWWVAPNKMTLPPQRPEGAPAIYKEINSLIV
jgi:hypothetical protein